MNLNFQNIEAFNFLICHNVKFEILFLIFEILSLKVPRKKLLSDYHCRKFYKGLDEKSHKS